MTPRWTTVPRPRSVDDAALESPDPVQVRGAVARAGTRVILLAAAGLLIAASGRVAPHAGHGTPAPDMRIDPARDKVTVIDVLPGVGPRIAAAMQSAASAAPFTDGRDLRRTRGIGARSAARLAPHVLLPSSPSTREDAPALHEP